jgi:hypothetical protein
MLRQPMEVWFSIVRNRTEAERPTHALTEKKDYIRAPPQRVRRAFAL